MLATRIMKPHSTDPFVWIVTDRDGRIEILSRPAAMLLGVRTAGGSHDLSRFFPRHRRGLAVDMEIALTGWPSVRTVVLSPMASHPVTVRYLVSRRVTAHTVELHWTFDMVETDYATAS